MQPREPRYPRKGATEKPMHLLVRQNEKIQKSDYKNVCDLISSTKVKPRIS
jgi:hypothetical protein